uniref:Uncharacterized protein n=1 Tax=viral metagenome TaxID=1070528 RepID=A0A6C0JQA0_9ZZZZ
MDSGGISAVIFAILFLVVSAAFTHKLWMEGALNSLSPNSGLDFLSLMVLYLPNTLFAYGFIADLMNSSYHYSVAGITALVGMIVNKVVGEPVIDALVSVFSFLGNQFLKLPLAAQAAVGAIGVGAAAAAAPIAAAIAAPAAAATNPFITAPAAAAATLPQIAAPAAAAAAAAPVVAAAAERNPFAEDAVRERSETATTGRENSGNPFLGGRKKQKGGATNMCSLPGFEWLENKTAPQGIVMSMTVLWYLMIELWDTGRTSQSVALGATTSAVFVAQTFIMYKNNCLAPYKYGVYSTIISLVMSIIFATSSYFIQKSFTPSSSASSVSPTQTNFGPKCPDGTVLNSTGTSCLPILQSKTVSKTLAVGAPTDTSAPVNDDDQFVCEAYKDGELVTSTIV